MPITIKKPKLRPLEERFCKSTIACAVMAVSMLVMLFAFMNKIVETGSKALTTAVFSVFIIYFLSCAICAVMGADTYRKEDSMSALGKCIIYIINVIVCLMNLRFALMLILAAYGADDAVTRLVGQQGQQEFIKAQYVPWFSLLTGAMIDLMVSVLSSWKLIRNK
ncbi:hypothetical protein [uncultured Ruminococcus sp.]|uniref:hypothetical protein n=1 Tax=uncultured Ruminococcus sp. TaxID=165186 RepID=UPI000ECC9902|nr:hypothetical protein [uncultured Ruminococcus sp.]HCJ40250.1 hypothetical protein [Ruminococcus sp.]